MEKSSNSDDPMDIEPPGSPSLPSTTYGSPSYSPPELEERTDTKGRLKNNYEKAAEEVDEMRRESRSKAKSKARISSSEADDDDDDDDKKIARRKAKGKARAYSPRKDDDKDDQERPGTSVPAAMRNPLRSHPTAAELPTMDMDEYWQMRFGEIDAALNDTLSSHSSRSSSYNYEADIENDPVATSAVRKSLSERRDLAQPSSLATLQQEQAGSSYRRGLGRGMGRGWGLEWKETIPQETVQRQRLGFHDEPHPSPVEDEMEWEVYDELVWERAAERAREQEAGRLTLKNPSAIRVDGIGKRVNDSNRMTDENPTKQKGEFVRAVTDYKAILRGTYLTYEKDDVMKVMHRESNGSSMF